MNNLEQLARYLPDFILNQLSSSGWNRRYPLKRQGSGAVMLVDMSGFTPLTRQLMREGASGLEQLTVILNTYFDTMTALIAEHGGQVVNFAGDALLAVWHTEETGGLPVPSLQAAALCGLRLQEALHHKELFPNLQLALRIAIGAGDYGIHFIGGVQGRWELILAGDAIGQMSACSPHAKAGEVLLSPEAYALIQSCCTGESASDGKSGFFVRQLTAGMHAAGWSAPAKPSLPEYGSLIPYLPPTVLSAVAAGQGDWAAELRNVTVLFIHLPDFHLQTDLEQMHQAIEIIQNTMLLQEGAINKISLDDKGVAVIAAMGLPAMTHEDDAARALQAGLTIRAHFAERGIASSIGISTGVVFCGSIGSDIRREYTMIGDTMNLAARLMQASDGSILCDETTCQSALESIRSESQGDLKLKGFAVPIRVYRPLEIIKTALPGHPPQALVGRKPEKEALRRRVEKLLEGTGGSVIISGEAGMGKSRLILYARGIAEEHHIRVLFGAGDSIEKLSPYYPWRQIFGECFGIGTLSQYKAVEQERLLGTVRSLLPSQEHLLPLLNAVLPLELEDNEWTASMTGRIRADNTQTILADLLRSAMGTLPGLIILDDVHWMDSASWSLLLEAAKQLPHVFFLLAMRPDSESLPAEYLFFARHPRTDLLELGQLSQEDTIELICDRLGVSCLPEEARKLILDKTEGHPLFSEELAYSLRDRGFLEIANGECRMVKQPGNMQDVLFHPTIQGIIMSRIDRLPPKEQLVLKAASVIGRLFTYTYLRGILPFQTVSDEFKGQLAALVEVNLTLLESVKPDLTYLFRHIITQEVTYNMLLLSQRKMLHRAAAVWLEQQYPDLSPFYSTLAYHWSKAEDTEKAIAYLEQVGMQALRTGAYPEAVHAFRGIMDAADQDSAPGTRLALWHRLLGESYMGVGDMSLAADHLKKALSLNGRHPADTPQQFKKHMAKQIAKQLLHRMRPSRYTGRMKRNSQEFTEQARCYFRLAEIAFFTNKPMDNIYYSIHGLNLGEEAGPSVELAQITGNMCVTAGIMTLHSLARAYKKQALQVAGKVGELISTAWVYMDFSLYHIGIGDWREAREYARSSMEIYEKIGDRRYWEACSYLYVKVLCYRDADFTASSGLAAAIYDSGSKSGNAQAKSWGLLAQAENKLYLGHTEEALVFLLEAEALIATNVGLTEEIRVFGQLALASLKLGRAAEAKPYAAKALALIEQSSPTAYYAYDGYAAVAEAYLTLWEMGGPEERRELLPCINSSMKALQAFSRIFPIAKPRLQLLTGTWAWLRGKPRQARRAWKNSLKLAAKLDMAYEEARTCLELGLRLQPGGREQDLYGKKARELMDHIGARIDM